MKLSLEDKKEIVRLYDEEGLGYNSISKKINLGCTTIKTIIRRYKNHGIYSLKHPPKQHKYSADFKMAVLKQVYEGKSKTSLAAEYNLSGPGIILSWMHKYEDLGYNGLISKQGRPKKNMNPEKEEKTNIVNSSPLTDKERKEFEDLKRKFEEVQMENEFLKKLDALVQERLKRERKK